MKVLFIMHNSNNAFILESLLKNGIEVDVVLSSYTYQLNKIISTVEKYTNNYYIVDKFVQEIDDLCRKNNYDFIFPSVSEWKIFAMADLNDRYSCPGILPGTAEFFYTKTNYYQAWKELNIPYPEVYQIPPAYAEIDVVAENIQYPCIIKPSLGSGGVGAKIVENETEVIDFFDNTDEKINEFQEKNGDAYKKLQYLCRGKDYIIQRYIRGDVVSLMGHVYKGSITIDFVFDIESHAYPYVAETGLIYPSKYPETVIRSKSLFYLEKFFHKTDYKNGMFMLDIIVDENDDIWFIDFSPRLSVSHFLLYYSGDKNYGINVVKKLMTGKHFDTAPNKSVLFRYLPFEKKDIKSIKVKKPELAESYSLPKGKIIMLRNDYAVDNNGYAIFVGNDRSDVESKYRDFVNNLEVIYSE